MIAVIGAGVSGLSCAWWLREQGMAVRVFEADDRVGGKVVSQHTGLAQIEAGPNTLYADTALLDWLRQLGLSPILPAAAGRQRHVLWQGRYHQLPAGPLDLLCGDFFSRQAKWRLLGDVWRRATPAPAGETVAAFFRRCLGEEVLAKAVAPFIGGVFAGDAEELLMAETLPQLAQLEATAGSISRGVLSQLLRGKVARKQAVSLQDGLASLPLRLAQDVDVRLNCPVQAIRRQGDAWLLETASGPCTARALVLALPAGPAARLLQDYDATAAQALQQIVHAPMTVVASVLDAAALRRPLHGFGGLHAPGEGAFAAGHLMSSLLYPQRCVPGQALITSFVGGRHYQQQAALADGPLLQGLNRELQQLFGLESVPLQQTIIRWPQALPQGTAAIAPARQAMQRLQRQGLHVCANWLDGVSLPDCLAKGRRLARQLAEQSEH